MHPFRTLLIATNIMRDHLSVPSELDLSDVSGISSAGSSTVSLASMEVEAEASEPTGASTLCSDTLISILSHLDAYALARLSSVCTLWRDAATSEVLWASHVRTRWQIDRKFGTRYKFGERTWREVFRVFHRRQRPPSIDGVGPREVAYATGRHGRVACWLYVTHLPACRLGQRASWLSPHEPVKVLQTRVVVQNLRDAPIALATNNPSACLALAMRDGEVAHPMPASAFDGSPTTTSKSLTSATATPEGAAGLHVLPPLGACLLHDVAFPVPRHMQFEPDVLEAAHKLRLRVGVMSCLKGGGVAPPIEVTCHFIPEAEIWDHYEAINRDFLVHHDSREQ